MGANKDFSQSLQELLGTKPTRSQVAVMRAMSSEPGLLITHARLLAVLDRRGDAMDRVTLYRTLERLVCAGILVSVVDDSRITRYAVTASQAPTSSTGARFECQRCRQQFLLPASTREISKTLNNATALTKASGHRLLEVELSILGICSGCITD